MTGNHLKPKTPETARRYEWELLKALAIISMILCNPVIRLGIHNPGYETAFPYFLGQTIFGNYLGVDHALVLAVGFGITEYIERNVHYGQRTRIKRNRQSGIQYSEILRTVTCCRR